TGLPVSLSASDLGITATDDVDGQVEVTLDPSSVSGIGEHTVTASCHDAAGNCASETFVFTITDTDGPVFTELSISETVLTHVNHKMQHLVVTAAASDAGGAAPTCRIVDVTSDEPVDGKGSGKTSPDWVITGDLTLDLRAERSGKGEGRTYTIT